MSDIVRPLPGPMQPGLVITIDGFLPPNAHLFNVNLSCASILLGGDVALHADHRFFDGGGVVVRNSYVQGQWGTEERSGTFPLYKNTEFQCTITSFPDKYQIAYNGQFFTDFRHRIPQGRVNHVIVRGTVQVYNVSFGGYEMPQVGALSNGGPSGCSGQQQPGYGQPVPAKKRKIPRGLYSGRMILISGTPNPSAKTFVINLKPEEFGGDIHFHMSVRFEESVVVRNAIFYGSWGQEERQHPPFPFHPGQPFNLIILTEQDGFKVSVDKKHFVDFAHRNPNIQSLQWVEADGDISRVTFNTTYSRSDHSTGVKTRQAIRRQVTD